MALFNMKLFGDKQEGIFGALKNILSPKPTPESGAPDLSSSAKKGEKDFSSIQEEIYDDFLLQSQIRRASDENAGILKKMWQKIQEVIFGGTFSSRAFKSEKKNSNLLKQKVDAKMASEEMAEDSLDWQDMTEVQKKVKVVHDVGAVLGAGFDTEKLEDAFKRAEKTFGAYNKGFRNNKSLRCEKLSEDSAKLADKLDVLKGKKMSFFAKDDMDLSSKKGRSRDDSDILLKTGAKLFENESESSHSAGKGMRLF